MNPAIALAMGSGGANPTYVDDVFSAYTYDGTGSAQAITNGIDLAGNGGMVWLKDRTSDNPAFIMDTNRGVSSTLQPSTISSAGTISTAITAFNNNGFTLGTNTNINTNANKYIGWTFRKAPKFFDIVTYTGNGTTQTLAHNLGIAPGMIVVKKLSSSSSVGWDVWHRSLTSGSHVWLNRTEAETASGATSWGNNSVVVDPTSTNFTVGQSGDMNANGATYVAYLFAHDPAADGLIQCGTFTTDTSGNATVSLGWEPQFLLYKTTTAVDSWNIVDTSRGWPVSSVNKALRTNTTQSEFDNVIIGITATGFAATAAQLSPSTTYIYMAIRRSNKPPTSGTQVFNAIARAGTGAAATITGVGFAPDSVLCAKRGAFSSHAWGSRLLGTSAYSRTSNTNSEFTETGILGYSMDGFTTINPSVWGDFNFSGATYINYFFKRAVGVFDVVCYTGTGATTTVAHGLDVVPEMIIFKNRTSAASWAVYHKDLGATKAVYLNDSGVGTTTSSFFNDTAPTSSVFTVNFSTAVNSSGDKHIAYLFATKAGISKVGSYTGNGTSLNVDCGFSAGARFVLIKRTDAAGDWLVADSARGIVAGNDPYLKLNSTESEVATEDWVDPLASGFIVNQVAATNVNVNAATYIFLAFA